MCWSAWRTVHMARGPWGAWHGARGMERVAWGASHACAARVQGRGCGGARRVLEARGTVAGESGGSSAVRRGVARAAGRGLASSAAGRLQVDSPVTSLKKYCRPSSLCAVCHTAPAAWVTRSTVPRRPS